jgi:hypothetical protein
MQVWYNLNTFLYAYIYIHINLPLYIHKYINIFIKTYIYINIHIQILTGEEDNEGVVLFVRISHICIY